MNKFYKPTPMYKEYQILGLISNNDTITQRMISESLNVAVSMVNKYLKEYEESGFIKINYISDKNVEYRLTKKGEDRIRFLNIGFLSSSNQVYDEARTSVLETLNNVLEKDTENIIMYGAGDVAGIIVDVLNHAQGANVKIIAIIDDDLDKQHTKVGNIEIIALEELKNYNYDEILISSYKQQDMIYEKIIQKVSNRVVKRYFPRT